MTILFVSNENKEVSLSKLNRLHVAHENANIRLMNKDLVDSKESQLNELKS